MPIIFLNSKHLKLKALFLSFVIHLILFKSIIFVFPIKQESPKPHFQFLGSILKSHNMFFISKDLENIAIKDDSTTKKLIKLKETSITHRTVDKPPSATKKQTLNEKITPKLVFPISLKDEETLKPKPSLKSLGIAETTPYKPLQLKNP